MGKRRKLPLNKKANAHKPAQTGNLMVKMVEFKSQIFFLLTTTEYQGVVVCMVSTVSLNSTILFNEDLIEEICVSTGLPATCCTFGISVNILSQYSKSEFKYFYYTYH